MKIQCDVCSDGEASVYCTADEAALCTECDHRVHHANKLAEKHSRFSLIQPTPKTAPLCDICQEKRAFLFCQQDRAILCRDCDIPIHKVNELTRNHNRFLLTGVKLSPTSEVYSSPALTNDTSDGVPSNKNVKSQKPVSVPNLVVKTTTNPTPVQNTISKSDMSAKSGNGSGFVSKSGTSSISEYLIETLPGWQVDDFLDFPSPYSKVADNDAMPFQDFGLMDGSLNSFSPDSMGMWVPQAPPPPQQAVTPLFSSTNIQFGFGGQMGSKDLLAFGTNNTAKSSRKWISDDVNCFTVPQINSPSNSSKRSRNLW